MTVTICMCHVSSLFNETDAGNSDVKVYVYKGLGVIV